MFQKIFVTMAIRGVLISSVYGSDTWPEKYVRNTNNKIWNLIQKRCSTALCKDHLNKLRTERLQSVGKVSGGCKNIYPPPRTYEERIRLCGNAESGTVLGRSTSSPSQKIMIKWVAGRRAIIMNQHWWKKTDEYDLLPVLWERKQRTWSLTVWCITFEMCLSERGAVW